MASAIQSRVGSGKDKGLKSKIEMIYYKNIPVKMIAVDRRFIGVVSLDRPLSASIWVKASQLTADKGLVEILDMAKEVEEWQTKHNTMITQKPLRIRRWRKKKNETNGTNSKS